ncbi:MAG: cytochrome c3 family protein [bacterium]|nr:cytochrome c3 family protein [bacterium]
MPRYLAIILGLTLLAAPAAASDQAVKEAHPHDRLHGHSEVPGAKGQCADCHLCAEPTAEDPCMVSCARHGGQFRGVHEVAEGPGVVVIDQLAARYEPVVFAHELHASMAAMSGGCTNCHHYSEDSGAIPTCRQCHAADRSEVDLSMPALKGAYHRQCMNCHLDWSGDNSCDFCHREAAEPGAPVAHDATDIVGIPHPVIEAVATYTYETSHADAPVVTFHHSDHVDVFGQQCVDCHRGDSCKSCHHGDQKPAEHARLDHVTSCCACHGERDCNFCHGREPMPRFDHALSTGFDLAPYHAGRACQDCHGDPRAFRYPSGDCAECHIHWEDGGFDHGITGLVLSADHEENDCSDCHVDLDFARRPSCDDCHDDYRFPAESPHCEICLNLMNEGDGRAAAPSCGHEVRRPVNPGRP